MLYVMLDRFDYDNGIVDHQTYRQNQAEKRKRINREAEYRKEYKGSHE